MKFKVPRVFYIKGKRWTIKFADLSKVGKADTDHIGLLGETNSETREIRIDRELKKDPKALTETVLHELMHACLFELHLGQIESFSADIEEIICDGFADIIQTTLIKYFYK